MKLAPLALLSIVAGCSANRAAPAEPGSAPALAPQADPLLDRARALFDEARAAQDRLDHQESRAKTSEAIDVLLAPGDGDESEVRMKLLFDVGVFAFDAADLLAASRAFVRVLEVRSRSLPEHDHRVQHTRQNLAGTLVRLGRLQEARVLQEEALAIASRTFPDDHAEVQSAREHLALVLDGLGDSEGARALQEKALAVALRTLPDDHPDLQSLRGNLATTLERLKDHAGALALQEKVLEVRERTLPADDLGLQIARINLAAILGRLGEFERSAALQEKAIAVLSRTQHPDHPDLQTARQGMALSKKAFGDLEGARGLQEQVLEVRSRSLPEGSRELHIARMNLGLTLAAMDDCAAARPLFEQALEAAERTLPDDHPDVLEARQCLAGAIHTLGDVEGALLLNRSLLEVRSLTLADDDSRLQVARANMAVSLHSVGDHEEARELFEKVIEIHSRRLPDDHPDLRAARSNLALTLRALGDEEAAREIHEQLLEIASRSLPEDDLELATARTNAAGSRARNADVEGARVLYEQVLDVYARRLPDDHPHLRCARHHLGGTLAELGDVAALRPLAAEFGRGMRALVQGALLASSREAEERVGNEAKHISFSLSFADHLGPEGSGDDAEAGELALVESARAAGICAAARRNAVRADPDARSLFDEATRASVELTRVAWSGTGDGAYVAAVRRRDEAQRAILARATSGREMASLLTEPTLESLARSLDPDEALVGFWRYERMRWSPIEGEKYLSYGTEESLLAHVILPGGELARVELGPIGPIESAVQAWRDAIGARKDRGVSAAGGAAAKERACGEELRRLVFDPLVPALGTARRVTVALDDVLHAIPLDALPLEDGLLGERYAIEQRLTLRELLWDRPPSAGEPMLLALGSASFNSEPLGPAAEDEAPPDAQLAAGAPPSMLRGGAWERGFEPLPYTGVEARGVAALFEEAFGERARAVVLEKRKASREAVDSMAPGAGWLHVATHGWFSPESMRSRADLPARDAGERVPGASPMVICGLALAGANLPVDALGRYPGLVTAEEISSWDLSRCALAVLSACDTNVGERRAGQGVASLQKALHMAGARSVVTSLWKVPDDVTSELMLDFYRRMWMERKPKAQALWEAKMKIRAAKDDAGKPRYTTRDWAAWVLTGEPE